MVTAALTQAFYELNDADYSTAVERFIERFGTSALIATVPFTRTEANGRRVFGLRPSVQFSAFEREHGSLFELYPNVAGLFGPQDAGFDYQTYERQYRAFRESKSQVERLNDLNHLLGTLAMNNVKAQLPVKPNTAQKRWLADWRRQLQTDYPGYTPNDFNPGDTSALIEDLFRAAGHDDLGGSDVAAAVREYVGYRQQAIDAAPTAGWNTANGSRHLRDWLREWAADISDRVPDFRRVWDQLLSRELSDDLEVED